MPPDRPQFRRGAASRFDPLIAGFAAWTCAANGVVFGAGSLRLLSLVGALAVIVALVLERRSRSADSALESVPDDSLTGPGYLERGAVFAVALLIAGLFAWREDPSDAWLIGLPLVWYQFARARAESGAGEFSAASSRARTRALWVIGIVCAVLTLVLQRPDPDDTFYVNIAVAVADHPGDAILVADTMHGIAGVALSLDAYRVQSYELLAGLIAWLTPLRALDGMHVLFPAISAFLIPFALARVLRRLVPRTWIWAVCFAVAFLWFTGSPHRGFGNFGFIRLQQGKAVLLCLILPLVLASGMRYAERPSARNWLLLAAVQVCALGANVTALFLAPVTAVLGFCAASTFRQERALATFGKALATSFYPVLVGLLLFSRAAGSVDGAASTAGDVAPISMTALTLSLGSAALGLMVLLRGGRSARAVAVLAGILCIGAVAHAVLEGSSGFIEGLGASKSGMQLAKRVAPVVLGNRWQVAFVFLVIFGGWSLAREARMRRLASFAALIFLTLYWNPLTTAEVSTRLLTPMTYWRVFWVLPATLLIGAFLAAPLERAPLCRRVLGWAVALPLSLCVMLVLPARATFDASNQTVLARPGWRVPAKDLAAARALTRFAPAGSSVLAPLRVSAWLPTLHDHPYPLIVRSLYVGMLAGVLTRAEIDRRLWLTEAMALPPSGAQLRLAGAIDDFELAALCMSKRAFKSRAREALESSPFEQVFENEEYVVWARPGVDHCD